MKRCYGADIFRIFCCIGVLVYHVFDDLLYLQNPVSDTIYYMAAYCVPGFFLLSGFLLSQKQSMPIE